MRDLMPQMSGIALLDNMANSSVSPQGDETQKAALVLGFQPQLSDTHEPDIEAAFNRAMAARIDALSVGNDSVVIAVDVH
jgi:hypothetical protein